MRRWEKRIRRARPASGGAGELSTPIIHHQSSFINPAGFTLVELLVVISIIALLMAVLLPTLGRVRKQARAVACQSNLRQWGVVFFMYMNEHNEKLDWRTWKTIPWWRWSCWYYSDSNDLLLCPMATRYEVNKDYPQWQAAVAMGYGKGSKFTAWKTRDDLAGGTFYGSYGLNSVAAIPSAAAGVRPGVLRAGSVGTPLLLDAVSWWCTPGSRHPPPAYDGDLSEPVGIKEYCINRHNGAVNGLFLDWSVRRVGLKELWTLKWHILCDTGGPWTRAGGVRPEEWPGWMRSFKDY